MSTSTKNRTRVMGEMIGGLSDAAEEHRATFEEIMEALAFMMLKVMDSTGYSAAKIPCGDQILILHAQERESDLRPEAPHPNTVH